MRNATLVLVLIAAAGCATKVPPAQSKATAGGGSVVTTPPATSSPRVPMTAEWVFQSEAAGRLTLVARVNRNAPIRIPTTVTVTVPTGLRVLSGRTSWVIEASESTAPVEEQLVFEIMQAGPQEIVLEADAQGTNFGVHAKKVYTLDMPVGKATLPAGQGPTLEVGGRNFGPSVPAKP